jgi:hypothetical protein
MLEMAAPANSKVPWSHRKANPSDPNIEFEEFRKHRKPGKVDARAEARRVDILFMLPPLPELGVRMK